MNTKPGFTGSPLDRLDHVREDPAALAELQSSLRARLLLLDGLDPVLAEDGGLSWGSLAEAPTDAELALLGLIDGTPRFVALTGAASGPPRAPALWRMLEHLPAGEASTYAAARSLVDWHARHRFCAKCGNSNGGVSCRVGAAMPGVRHAAFSPHRSGRDHARGT
jgi:NAD+ diphosphatase